MLFLFRNNPKSIVKRQIKLIGLAISIINWYLAGNLDGNILQSAKFKSLEQVIIKIRKNNILLRKTEFKMNPKFIKIFDDWEKFYQARENSYVSMRIMQEFQFARNSLNMYKDLLELYLKD